MLNGQRLLESLQALGQVGAIEGGGCCRLAFTDQDRQGRELVADWMREAGLRVRQDAAGNVIGRRAGREELPSVMVGSHIDTVRTGGLYDGNLGVLAGLEVVRSLNDAGRRTLRPLEVAFFSNEEGARFPPDMMGSLMYVGDLRHEDLSPELQQALSPFEGPEALPGPAPHAYLELHIEQGPVLDFEGLQVGVVTGVQGISWQRIVLGGQSNHAGTTPMRMRRDAALAAAQVVRAVHDLATGDAVATVGCLRLGPDLINVVPNRAELTVDLRSPDSEQLLAMEMALDELLAGMVVLERERLVRLEPMAFDPGLVDRVAAAAARQGLSHRRMVSGAGHDAQILARVCRSAMVFVPSVAGISHNVREHTAPADLVAGAEVLAEVLVDLADQSV